MKPLTVYGHWAAPNPFKVVTILRELNIPYDYHIIEFSDVKQESFVKINPNGRLPAVVDPNTGTTIWESGAIILYLVENYDKEGRISFQTSAKKYECLQWLFFQVSGQGPYFGQATWFLRFHPEKIQSATDRYINETIRVIGVLDSVLEGKDWLVGDTCSYADLSFVTWAFIAKGVLEQVGKADILQKNANYSRWLAAMQERDSIKYVVDTMAKERAAHGLPP